MDLMNNYGHDDGLYINSIGIISINTDYCGVLCMPYIKSVINYKCTNNLCYFVHC